LRDRRSGFTLVELVTVVAVTLLLVGLLLPAVQAARDAARRIECQNKIRQIGLALSMRADALKSFPPGTNTDATRMFQSWCVQILPFLDQSNAYHISERGFSNGGSVFNVIEHPLFQEANVVFGCPSDGRVFEPAFAKHNFLLAGLTSYLGSSGTNYLQQDGVLYAGSRVRLGEVRDGLSNTLLLGERPPSPSNDFGWWYAGMGARIRTADVRATGSLDHTLGVREAASTPYANCDSSESFFHSPTKYDDECSANYYWSFHGGGANFVFCDGSVRMITYAEAGVLDQLATRDRGDIVILNN
jgi:prepilin-type processing-associated H-X9-DG protein